MNLLACLRTNHGDTIGLIGTDRGTLRWESDTPGLARDADRFVPLDDIPESGGEPAAWAISRLARFLPGQHTVLGDNIHPSEFYDAPPKRAHVLESVEADVTEAFKVPTVGQINRAAKEADRNPSHGRRESGTYKKGRIRIHGLSVTIEVAKGGFRRGVSANGKPWEIEMQWPYGYITQIHGESAGKVGADDEHMDCFLGPNPESEVIFVVDQKRFDGSFDEHKVFIGWTNAKEVKAAYMCHYDPAWKGFAGIKAMTLPDFKKWLEKGDTSVAIAESLEAEPADLLEDKALFGPSFTGVITDSLGRKMTFVDGKHVKGNGTEEDPKEVHHATLKGQKVHVIFHDPVNHMVKVVREDGVEGIVPDTELNKIDPASPEWNADAEKYMDKRMPILDAMVEKAEEDKETVTGAAPSWDDLDSDTQQEAMDSFVQGNVDSYYESEVESWREGLHEQVVEDLRGDHGWHDEAFVDWAVTNDFTKESAEAALEISYQRLDYDKITWYDAAEFPDELRRAVFDYLNARPEPILAWEVPASIVYKKLQEGLYPALKGDEPDAIHDIGLILEDIRREQLYGNHKIERKHSYSKDGMNPDFTKLVYDEGNGPHSLGEDGENPDEWQEQWEDEYKDLQDKEIDRREDDAEPPDDLMDAARENCEESFN
jgi:hypothetical protein